MDNDTGTLDDNDWIDDLSEIQNKLSQTEISEIVYLYGDSLKGKFFSVYFFKTRNIDAETSKRLIFEVEVIGSGTSIEIH